MLREHPGRRRRRSRITRLPPPVEPRSRRSRLAAVDDHLDVGLVLVVVASACRRAGRRAARVSRSRSSGESFATIGGRSCPSPALSPVRSQLPPRLRLDATPRRDRPVLAPSGSSSPAPRRQLRQLVALAAQPHRVARVREVDDELVPGELPGDRQHHLGGRAAARSRRSRAARRACGRARRPCAGARSALKSSSARSILSWALVGTARTWRGSRGARAPDQRSQRRRPRRSSGSAGSPVGVAAAARASLHRLGPRPASAVAAPAPAPAQQPAALGLALRPGRRLGRGRLADPALLLRARRAELADELALARRRR